MTWIFRSASAVLAAGLLFAAGDGFGQTRRVTAPPAPARDKVVIRKLEGLGNSGRVATPEYRVVQATTELPAKQQEWGRVRVCFETEAEWIDELEFRYYVQVRDRSLGQARIFTGMFTYIDIPRGKEHYSAAFLRPATLQRYGEIVGIAVEIYSRGALTAYACNPESPPNWWRTSLLRTVPDVLLERSQTPFALQSIDAYQTPKPPR